MERSDHFEIAFIVQDVPGPILPLRNKLSDFLEERVVPDRGRNSRSYPQIFVCWRVCRMCELSCCSRVTAALNSWMFFCLTSVGEPAIGPQYLRIQPAAIRACQEAHHVRDILRLAE